MDDQQHRDGDGPEDGGTIDAWRRLEDLWAATSATWEVRPDLRVVARGPDRCVELSLGERRERRQGSLGARWDWRSTRRNLATMRELALCLWAACDLVEEVNPDWARGMQPPSPPEAFRRED